MLVRSTGNPEVDAYIEFEVRYNQTRWAEVWLAIKMTCIGIVLLHSGHTFDLSPGYNVIKSYVSEDVAGTIAIMFGPARLFALWVNGSKRRSPVIRMVGCAGGFLFWSALSVGFLIPAATGELGAWPLALAIFVPSVFAELHSLGRASRDATAYHRFKRVGPPSLSAGPRNAFVASRFA